MRFHRVRVVRRMPHPGRGFTQGLIVDGGTVWESTGLYGESTLRRYQLGASAADGQAALPEELFGEGICRVGDHIWQLTWLERVALRWDPHTLTVRETVAYNREGWGICAAGEYVLTSDGSGELVRRDPETLAPEAVITVRCAGGRVQGLNDLTWSGGVVWANVIGTTRLAGIDPESGEVTDVVDASAAGERHWGNPQAVMNGIAALAEREFLVTGKSWRSIRHVRLVPGRAHPRPDLLLNGGRAGPGRR